MVLNILSNFKILQQLDFTLNIAPRSSPTNTSFLTDQHVVSHRPTPRSSTTNGAFVGEEKQYILLG